MKKFKFGEKARLKAGGVCGSRASLIFPQVFPSSLDLLLLVSLHLVHSEAIRVD